MTVLHRLLVISLVSCAPLVWSGGAWAVGASDIANPPEDPLPPLAPVLRAAPSGPEYGAPSPQELLKECASKDFVECMRAWRPPPPPPPPPEPPMPTAEEQKAKEEAEKRQAAAKPPPPPPPAPGAPGQPPENAPLTGKAPPPNPAADKATLDALSQAIKDAGLAGKIRLPDTPTDGSVEMKLDDKKPAKPPVSKK